MAKATKIDDVKQPGRALPSATSRPILIAEHTDTPVTDPMLATPSADAGNTDEAPAESIPMTHTAKTIEPLTAPTVKRVVADIESTPTLPVNEPESKPAEDSKPSETPEDESKSAQNEPPEESAATITPSSSTTTAAVATTEASPSTDSADDEDAVRDPDAAISAEEAAVAEAKAKREQELEDVIASGKYAVPINAVQRRRSRIHTILLCVLAAVLFLLLLDVVIDVGIISAPQGVPHTHFFTKE